jgi:hypothetical protein
VISAPKSYDKTYTKAQKKKKKNNHREVTGKE